MGALSWNSGNENLAEDLVLMQELLPKGVDRTVGAKGKGGSPRCLETMNLGNRNTQEEREDSEMDRGLEKFEVKLDCLHETIGLAFCRV